MTCSGVPLPEIPAAARPEPKMARPMPASPQNSSSEATGSMSPLGSAKAWATKSNPYRPISAASLTTGQGNSSRSSHSWATGRMASSAKSCTHFWTCCTSSGSVSENSVMATSYQAVTPSTMGRPAGSHVAGGRPPWRDGRPGGGGGGCHQAGHQEQSEPDQRRAHHVRRGDTHVLEQDAAECRPHDAGQGAGRLLETESPAATGVVGAVGHERRQRGRGQPL